MTNRVHDALMLPLQWLVGQIAELRMPRPLLLDKKHKLSRRCQRPYRFTCLAPAVDTIPRPLSQLLCNTKLDKGTILR
ncbi:hypothetical protein DF110_28570 [Burkholderia stagnalis]|nr:hypothetical protein DF110_28570 [Burkholderia stagnalis]